MPNTFAYTSNWVTMRTLDLLVNKLEVGAFFNTEFNRELTQEFPVGSTFNVKLPQMFIPRTGLGYNPQTINRRTTPVTCDQVIGVDFEWDSIELALNMERGEEEIEKQYLMPAAAALKQELDSKCAQWAYLNSPNIVGSLGTNPTSFQTIDQAREQLVEMGCPPGGDKGLLIPPAISVALSNAGVTYFNPTGNISQQYKEGSLGRTKGFDVYESMSLYDHTAGTWAGAVTVTGAGQSGSTLNVTATTGDTFLAGDIISIANVFPTNPMTRRTTQRANAKTFVITQNTTAAANAAALPIYPAIVGPGSPYQNVNALPAAGAALTLFPGTVTPNGRTGKQGLAMHANAFALVSVKFQNPKAVEIASQTRDPKTGVSIAFVRAFDAVQRKWINRFDMMIGFGNLYAENCSVRVLGA